MTGATEGGAGAGTAASASRASAGAKLKAAREAQTLTIEAVAQQLKLAPRQVKALENDDYGHLPGRTFVRGFARNYARFVHLDPDAVVALLPNADAAPALERPGFGPVRRPMGELPMDRAPRRSPLRWTFPLVLVVIVGVAAYYEYLRQHGMLHPIAERVAAVTAGATAGGSTPTGSRAAPAAELASLPNPLAAHEPAAEPGAAAQGPAGAAPAAASQPAVAPASADIAPPVPPVSPAPRADAATAGTTGSISVATPASSGASPLVLKFNGPSWVEVRDASGRVILKATEAAGTTRSVDGTAPFQLTIGDAPKVAVTFRGQPLDLGPYTRGDVARVTLE